MASQDGSGTVLKILTGVQSGVDVHLVDGTYMLGSGDDDDIQLIDVSLKPGHARLTLARGKIEIAGAAGELRTRNGVVLAEKGDAQEIEPLDIVSGGTSRFALGPRNANWSSIANAEVGDVVASSAARRRETARAAEASLSRWRSLRSAAPLAIAVAVIVGGVWLSPLAQANRNTDAGEVARTDLETIRDAVGGLPFGSRLAIEQQIDGVIYVTGFVDSPLERRAVIAATRDVEVPPRVRLQVVDTIRSEIASLIEEEKIDVAFTVTPDGRATLTGTVLDADRVARLVGLVEERLPGLASLTSEVRTAPSLFAEVKALAARSQIEPLVLFRLDGELIEASGVLPTEKIDAWVGFLQTYASRFADAIALRSLVQLQNPDGTVVDAPAPGAAPGAEAPVPEVGLLLGTSSAGSAGDVPLDVGRLRDGAFELADVFVGLPNAAAAGEAGNVAGGTTAGSATTPGAAAGARAGIGAGTGAYTASGIATDAASLAASQSRRLDLGTLLGNGSARGAVDPSRAGTAGVDRSVVGATTGSAVVVPGREARQGDASASGATNGTGASGATEADSTAGERERTADGTASGSTSASGSSASPFGSGSANGRTGAGADDLDPGARATGALSALTGAGASAQDDGRAGAPTAGENAASSSAEGSANGGQGGTGQGGTTLGRSSSSPVASAAAGAQTGADDAASSPAKDGTAAAPDAGTPVDDTVDDKPLDLSSDLARRLITRWSTGTLPADESGRRLEIGMDALQRGDVLSGNPTIEFGPIIRRYAPLLAEKTLAEIPDDACWTGSRLTERSVGGALFWLDFLSVTRDIALADLDADLQLSILETALNPEDVTRCVERGNRRIRSVYLAEVGRNPDFIGFITRDFLPFALDIAGADIGAGRYIQTRDGRKMRQGSAPDATSRVAVVGELGVALKREDSYATVLYDDRVSWLVR